MEDFKSLDILALMENLVSVVQDVVIVVQAPVLPASLGLS